MGKERRETSKQRVHEHAKGPGVRGAAHEAVLEQLGRREHGRPAAPARGHARRVAKVRESNAAIRRKPDVRGLHVKVRDAPRMNMCERRRELRRMCAWASHNRSAAMRSARTCRIIRAADRSSSSRGRQELRQVAVAALHDHERVILYVTRPEQLDDVLVRALVQRGELELDLTLLHRS